MLLTNISECQFEKHQIRKKGKLLPSSIMGPEKFINWLWRNQQGFFTLLEYSSLEKDTAGWIRGCLDWQDKRDKEMKILHFRQLHLIRWLNIYIFATIFAIEIYTILAYKFRGKQSLFDCR